MKNKKNDILLIAVFVLLLLVPVLAINREHGRISEGENRILASFPALLDEQGGISRDFTSEFEAYLNDNIGFRSQLMETAVDLRANRFGLSPNSQVHIGKDGWYFYTLKNSLDIAAGTHPILEYPDALSIIAAHQQQISDAYAAQGIDYVLVLMPCKASVYPEYVGGANYTVGVSPCDLLEDYMRANTSVRVLCVKDTLLEHKAQGKQFQQCDTHWTELGAYNAYREIFSYLAQEGLADGAPVQAAFSDVQKRSGNLLNIMGACEPFPAETVPDAAWDAHAALEHSGELFSALAQLRAPSLISVLRNAQAPARNLLCYTDSQWMREFNLPQLFAEHFAQTVCIDTRMRDPRIDGLAAPNLVIYAASEQDFLDQLIHAKPYE